MILQALNDYYVRKMADPDPARRLAAFGREDKEIPFVLELHPDGRLAAITDTRSGDGKKKTATRYLVPKGVKKTSGVAANLLWDNAEYVLGLPDPKKLADATQKGKADDYLARLKDMHAAFLKRIEALPASAQDDAGLRAVRAFLAAAPADALALRADAQDIVATNPVLTFRLVSDNDLVCQRPAVADAAVGDEDSDGDEEAGGAAGATDTAAPLMCLVSGELAPPARLHTAIKGVWGAQTSGANIVSFNLDAFNSYGKAQGANAPVCTKAAFAYTTALNSLLAKGSQQRVQVGDASTVFWAQRSEDKAVEEWMRDVFEDTDDPDARTDRVKSLLQAIYTGRFHVGSGEGRFYVLGLAPNAARISVRFWHDASIAEIATCIKSWVDDLEIAGSPEKSVLPSLRRLLSSVCLSTKERPYGDVDKLPQHLVESVVRAAFTGGLLPRLLFNLAIQRCRSEQAKKDDAGKPVRHVSYLRAAIMRAFLNRLWRLQPTQKEMSVGLDINNRMPPYLLGRKFAVFERMQEVSAERELNRSIRDAYFGAAMATPRVVFPRLIKLNQHHFQDIRRDKRKQGLATYFDRWLLEINDKLKPETAYPSVMPIEDQGVFALGYYHQRQAFPKGNRAEADTDTDTTTTPLAA